jgi:hypothetical protein
MEGMSPGLPVLKRNRLAVSTGGGVVAVGVATTTCSAILVTSTTWGGWVAAGLPGRYRGACGQ